MKRKRTKTAITHDRAFFSAQSLRVVVFSCLVLLLTLSPAAHSRDDSKKPRYAIIFGTVWGPDDQPFPDMEVKVRRANEKKVRWDVYSNQRGEFEITVPAGQADYIVRAETRHYKLADGRHLQPSPEVTVHIDNDERADTGLHLK